MVVQQSNEHTDSKHNPKVNFIICLLPSSDLNCNIIIKKVQDLLVQLADETELKDIFNKVIQIKKNFF